MNFEYTEIFCDNCVGCGAVADGDGECGFIRELDYMAYNVNEGEF